MPEVPACCPRCDAALIWQVDVGVAREVAFAHPDSPRFPFACPRCDDLVAIAFEWSLEVGAAARRLQVIGGAATRESEEPAILLVHPCPHDCGVKLGLQLRDDDPWAHGQHFVDEVAVLGGYRCPRCDGEGRLCIRPSIEPYELES